jgi:hypothetical protein
LCWLGIARLLTKQIVAKQMNGWMGGSGSLVILLVIRRASSRARYYAERVTGDQQDLLVPVVCSGAQ